MGRIRDTLPAARLIVILRDPVERAHSNWTHLWSAGLEPIEQRQELLPRFESDIELLERVLGEDFRDWVRPREHSGGMVGVRPAGQGQARNGRPAPGKGREAKDPPAKDLSEAR